MHLGSWTGHAPLIYGRRCQQTAMLLPLGCSRQSKSPHISTWWIAWLQGLCWEQLGWRQAIRWRGQEEREGGKARDHERGTASCQSTAAATLSQAPFFIAQVAAGITSPEVPPPHTAWMQSQSSPFCCRASWRLVSMSCSVATRLRDRLPAGLGGPWAGQQVVSCKDGDGGWHQACVSHGQGAWIPLAAIPWVRGYAPAWRG